MHRLAKVSLFKSVLFDAYECMYSPVTSRMVHSEKKCCGGIENNAMNNKSIRCSNCGSGLFIKKHASPFLKIPGFNICLITLDTKSVTDHILCQTKQKKLNKKPLQMEKKII